MTDASLHIILPAYNPLQGWQDRLIERLLPVYDLLKDRFEIKITLVNDGGNPLTWDSDLLPLQLVTHDKNRGKGAAIRTAIQSTYEGLVLITDIDIPYMEEDMLGVIEALSKGSEVVIGTRNDNYFTRIPRSRKWVSKSLIFFNKWLLRMRNPDTQAGIKGVRGRGIEAIKSTLISGFLYEIEWIRNAEKNDLKMASVQVSIRETITLSSISGKKLHTQIINYIRLFLSR